MYKVRNSGYVILTALDKVRSRIVAAGIDASPFAFFGSYESAVSFKNGNDSDSARTDENAVRFFRYPDVFLKNKGVLDDLVLEDRIEQIRREFQSFPE